MRSKDLLFIKRKNTGTLMLMLCLSVLVRTTAAQDIINTLNSPAVLQAYTQVDNSGATQNKARSTWFELGEAFGTLTSVKLQLKSGIYQQAVSHVVHLYKSSAGGTAPTQFVARLGSQVTTLGDHYNGYAWIVAFELVTFTPASPISLEKNTRYWIVLANCSSLTGEVEQFPTVTAPTSSVTTSGVTFWTGGTSVAGWTGPFQDVGCSDNSSWT